MLWTMGLQRKMYTIQSLEYTPWSSFPFHVKKNFKEHIHLIDFDMACVIDSTTIVHIERNRTNELQT